LALASIFVLNSRQPVHLATLF